MTRATSHRTLWVLAAAIAAQWITAVDVAMPVIVADPPVHVSVADRDRQMGELDLAADPVDPRRLLACAMTYSSEENRSWISAYLTEDRGRTWRRVLQTRGSGRRSEGDPACAFGRDGRAYVTAMSNPWIGLFTGDQHLLVYRSLDGGGTWSQTAAMLTTGMAFDREFLAVDNTGGPRDGTLYMNAIAGPPERGSKDSKDGPGVALWTSRDRSGTFESPVFHPPVPGQSTLQRSNGVVLSDGTVTFLFGSKLPKSMASAGSQVIVLRTPSPPDAELMLARSADGGRSLRFSSPVSDLYAGPSLALGGQMQWLAADPGSSPFKDRLYVVWADSRSGRSEILLSHSSDRGETWSAPLYVNDDHGAATTRGWGEHGMPVVAVNRDGVVGVMWYDRRSVPDSLGWDIRFVASLDGGETFLPSVVVSSATSGFGPELRLHTMAYVDERVGVRHGHGVQVRIQGRQFFAGDTAGLTADTGGAFHPVWIDHATGTPQLWTTTVKVDGRGAHVRDHGSLVDVSGAVTLEFQSTSFDQQTGEVTVTVALRNTSTAALSLPLTMQIQALSSEVAEGIEAQHADNGSCRSDATWLFGDEPATRLEPQARTKSRQLRFKLTDRRPYRTATGYRTELVGMHVRVLAPKDD